MRVVTRAFSMASTVSGRPVPVPGAGANWALARKAKSKDNSKQQREAMRTGTGHAPCSGWADADGFANWRAVTKWPRNEMRRKATLCGCATARGKPRDLSESLLTPTRRHFQFLEKARSSPRRSATQAKDTTTF